MLNSTFISPLLQCQTIFLLPFLTHENSYLESFLCWITLYIHDHIYGILGSSCDETINVKEFIFTAIHDHVNSNFPSLHCISFLHFLHCHGVCLQPWMTIYVISLGDIYDNLRRYFRSVMY